MSTVIVRDSEKEYIHQVQCTVAGCHRRLTPILLATFNIQILPKTFAKINKIMHNEKKTIKTLEHIKLVRVTSTTTANVP